MVEYMILSTDTPAGAIYIASYENMLIRIDTDYLSFLKGIKKYGEAIENKNELLDEAGYQLNLYFSKKLKRFDLPLYLDGTEFYRAVWTELIKIPYGTTTTYGHIAENIGRPRAVRAAGRAIGANPLPFVIPCHRVIGKNGSLVGFGLGLDVKKFLLELESA
ncbi:MAG: methylated-DNA--[protein]-cysteine S-methyltransferase [Thermoanaerobacteraceae bacterium]|nr:methylated-DNA--[protein]-cysteine S-methyltransferase [Thermoanaerobacteraceae bacterium]